MEHDTILGRINATHWAHGRTGRISTMHAGHRYRALAGFAVIDGNDAPTVDAPRHLILVLACGDAGIAVDSTVRTAKEFHSRHRSASHAARIWQRVALGSCMPVAGS